MADSQRKTANLFDKDTAPSLSLYINTGDMIIRTNADARLTYIPCKANTEYIVLKNSGTRFTIATTATVPDANVSILNYSVDNTGSMLRITTTSTSEYLAVWYWRTADTITEEQMRDSIMIVEGSTAPSSYEPYGWVHSLRKLGTSTDTITTLPADVYADGNNATVGLVGNMSQSGTPTPTTPIRPQECGDRTAQLWDISSWDGATAQRGTLERVTNGYKLTATSNDAYTITYGSGIYSYSVIGGNEYTISWTVDNPQIYGVIYIFTGTSVADTPLTTAVASSGSQTFTVPSGHNYVAFRLGVSSIGDEITYTNIMLNTGSTAKPHEPYGYKIPISSANTTTPVYLGEVESTRKIAKYELTGQERWVKESITGAENRYHGNDILSDCGYNLIGVCSHYNYAVANNYGNLFIASNKTDIFILDADITSATDLKTYLQQQYAAGTPVCVWYVLATPTTGILNEPLRKIGDYADTVSGVTIPTTTGADSFDVLTTLKPSEVELTYTGWHDASAKEWDGSEWK